MAEFTAAAFLDAAKKRYGTDALRRRVRGAQQTEGSTNAALADVELLKIAASVIGRVQAAARASVGWPLQGTWPAGSLDETLTPPANDIGGVAYSDRWPTELLQRALELFNWRTQAQLEQVSDHAMQIGRTAEKYFDQVESGGISLNLGIDTDVGDPEPLAARDRSGAALRDGYTDRSNVLESLEGYGWDYV